MILSVFADFLQKLSYCYISTHLAMNYHIKYQLHKNVALASSHRQDACATRSKIFPLRDRHPPPRPEGAIATHVCLSPDLGWAVENLRGAIAVVF